MLRNSRPLGEPGHLSWAYPTLGGGKGIESQGGAADFKESANSADGCVTKVNALEFQSVRRRNTRDSLPVHG